MHQYQTDFLNTIKPMIIADMRRTGILASLTAAQAIFESGWGRDELPKKANNLFGMKGNYKGESVIMPTKEWMNGQYITVNSAFRKYPSWQESVNDHSEKFLTMERYRNLRGCTDYKLACRYVYEDGYASAPDYTQKLIRAIDQYRLYEWDAEAATGAKNEVTEVMKKSTLATLVFDFGTKKSNPRTKRVTKITPHIMDVITTDPVRVAKANYTGTRDASANYYVAGGKICAGVSEDRRSWASSSAANDQAAITIEVANCQGAPDYPVSAADYQALIALCADICERYGITPHYDGTPNGTITVHRMFAKKACVPTDTEVLTRTGWLRIGDVAIGDEIACVALDGLRVSFEEVYDKVPVKQQDTYTSNGITATKDHRMVYRGQYGSNWRIEYYNKLLARTDTEQIYIPLAGYSNNNGLEMSNEMLQLCVATQADGHYMYENRQDGGKTYYGVEFHLKKSRKVERIKEILAALKIEYRESYQSDGSVKIRAYNQSGTNIVEDMLERWLHNKQFTWEWLEMSPEQAAFYIGELQLWDGCVAATLYTSRVHENLDIVSAIAAINGIGSRVTGDNIKFRTSPHITLSHDVKRNSRCRNQTLTEVTCVSVKTGMFIARQQGRPFVTGNCPGAWMMRKIESGQFERDILTAISGAAGGRQSVAGVHQKLYRVQVGAFKVREYADKFAEQMKLMNEKTIVVQDGGMYKVQVGAYADKNNAERHALKLKAGGYSAFII